MCNGTIIDQRQVELLPTPVSGGVEAYRIVYSSDGLSVVGFIVKPKEVKGKVPLLIHNRGGAEERGIINDATLSTNLSFWASRGYVVLASQYRGTDGGEGQDSWGGADINDVINLVKVAQQLPYADTTKIVMYGQSRGGLMTYRAIRHGLPLKAAAIVNGVTDLQHLYANREESMREILLRLVGDPFTNAEEYIKRSPIHWVEDINVPLFVVHGAKDSHVPVQQTRAFVQRLLELGKRHTYVEYPEADHFLRGLFKDYRPKIADFFDCYCADVNS